MSISASPQVEKLLESLKVIAEYAERVPISSVEEAEEAIGELGLLAQLSIQEYVESLEAQAAE